jgi:microcystin-dependent protein
MGYGNNAPPIGAIIAYAGPIDGQTLTKLEAMGWYPCNGDLLDKAAYPDLAPIISNNFGGTSSSFNVPDLRGRFIRGYSGNTNNDPDNSTRTNSGPGGVIGNHVGTLQGYATALPHGNRFTTGNSGSHTHTSDKVPQGENENAAALGSIHGYPEEGTQSTSTDGAHFHTSVRPSSTQQSGDKETRPLNAAINFLIKCKDGVTSTGNYIPSGTIIMYCAAVGNGPAAALAPNWLPVEGQTLTNADDNYPELYQALTENSTLEPDGGTTVVLPDLRGFFIRACTHDEVPGQSHPFQTALPMTTPIAFDSKGDHNHTINSGTSLGTSDHCSGHDNAYGGNTVAVDSAGDHSHSVTGGGDTETRPVNLALDFLIRVKN